MCACGQTGKLRRGMCGKCYARWLRQQPASLRLSVTDRWHSKFTTGAGCWEWQGTRTPKGYGQFSPSGSRHVYAHRYAWEQVNGSIPDGLTIDHLCGNRACVNPAHLEPVSRGENALRGNGPAALNARKAKCPQGHDYDRIYDGHRRCSQCDRLRRLGEQP